MVTFDICSNAGGGGKSGIKVLAQGFLESQRGTAQLLKPLVEMLSSHTCPLESLFILDVHLGSTFWFGLAFAPTIKFL